MTLEQINTAIHINQNRLNRLYKAKSEAIFDPDYNVSERLINTINELLRIDIREDRRLLEQVNGRQYYYQFMRYNTKLSLKRISKLLVESSPDGKGYKHHPQDHTTIIHALEQFEFRYKFEKQYAKEYNRISEIMFKFEKN
jgi:chromosomal replication initiation ATPase DnaA